MNYDEILAAMNKRYSELTGFDADDASDIGIRFKVLAAEVSELYGQISELHSQVFPQTSTGGYLDMHAQTRGLTRKAAIPAAGTLRFSRETAGATDITIPAGTLCTTRPVPAGSEVCQFETTVHAILPAGETSVEVPAVAVEAGRNGNVATGAVCLMITAVAGVSGVSNPVSFSGGLDAEDDKALRERLLNSYGNISNGTNIAYYYDLAMSHDGVASVNILPRNRGRGTVDVVVYCASAPAQPQVIADLQEQMNYQKEINVDVSVYGAVCDLVNVSLQLAVGEEYDYEVVAAKCEAAIEAHLSGLAVGEALLLANIGRAVIGTDGVYNYRISNPAADVYPAKDHVLKSGGTALSRMAVG